MQKRYQWDKNFSNGDRYRGEAIGENVKDGIGEYTWSATGAVYKGSWANDQPHGDGVMTMPDSSAASNTVGSSSSAAATPVGDGYTYEGHFERGQRSGRGTCHFTNGRVYVGEWKLDEMGGQGTLTGSSSAADDFKEYRGPFLRGRRHGAEGHCTYTNGGTYTGAWVQGKRQGHGRWQLASSASSGPARTDPVPTDVGAGKVPLPPMTPVMAVAEYTGNFLNDVPSCTADGVVRYVDGSSYTGAVEGLEVRRHGEGVLKMANGDVYTGHFRENLRHGEGTLRCAADGSTYEAQWRNDELDGQLTYRRPTRSTSRGGRSEDADGGRASLSHSRLRQDSPLSVVSYAGPCRRNELTGAGAHITYSDLSAYRGEVRHSVPAGAGVLESRLLTAQDGVPDILLANGLAMMLVRYEGSFFAGLADGQGTGSVRFVSPSAVDGAYGGSINNSNGNGSRGGFGASVSPIASVPKGCRGLLVNYQRSGTYAGRWSHGLPQGAGRWGWDDGDAYQGEVQAGGLPSCSSGGSYKSAQCTYEGGFDQGLPRGRGVYRHLLTQETYDGEWADGLFEGEGTYKEFERGAAANRKQPPCVVYTGQWMGGRMHGQGTEHRTVAAPTGTLDGDPVFTDVPTVYKGTFAHGMYHGAGHLSIDTAGAGRGGGGGDSRVDSYEGRFQEGTRTGQGVLTLADGTRLEGEFRIGHPHGDRIVARFPSGIEYRGPYKEGRPCGVGEMDYPNGDRYKGEVEPSASDADGVAARWLPQRHGKGVFTFAEGNTLACTWRHNVLHGEGTYTSTTGEVSTRQYVDGVVEVKLKAAGNNIFTAENELPNTLSEDALRKAQPEGKKPFAFVRKGEGGGVAAAAAKTTNANAPSQSTATTAGGGAGGKTGNTSPRRNKTAKRDGSGGQAPASAGDHAPSAAAAAAAGRKKVVNGRDGAATPAASSSAAAAPGRRATGGGSLATATTPQTSVSRSPRRSSRAVGSVSPEESGGRSPQLPALPSSPSTHARSKAEVQAAIAKRMASRGAGSGVVSTRRLSSSPRGSQQLSPQTSMRASRSPVEALDSSPERGTMVSEIATSKRPSLVEVFQEGIGKLDTCAVTTTTAAESTDSIGSATVTPAVSQRGRRAGGGSGAAAASASDGPVRGPLKGQLRAMMEEACAIRSSKEDEVHLLTEELRVLNEKIWQLRFSMTAADRKRSKGLSGAEQRLAGMMEERRGTVEKLNTLLQMSETP